jgi:Fusaric acid resistance protein-like
MGQLTLARFRGDTTFGLVARIISTFAGGLTGAAIWHVSTGGGKGNPYGLAVTCAVAFPIFFYGRLYWPGPSVSNTIFFTTTALVSIHLRKNVINGANPCPPFKVIGYSWQNTHHHFGEFLYYGINLAWARGFKCAMLFAYLTVVLEAVCSCVCGSILRVVSFTHTVLYTGQ